MMFEKAKPFQPRADAPAGGRPAEEQAYMRRAVTGAEEGRFAARSVRRAGDALRAVEWSEITARLNAARDLRLLLRTESQAPIEAATASFGDAAASYFALLDDGEPVLNHDALGQSKDRGAMVDADEANRPDDASGFHSDAPGGDARDNQ
ncbi:MAG: hypothetical protein EAY70_03745 [Sphingomonadales bacterium]|nr:MAG: hypothetical protein EAY70_03745 [Sphingomonadales bacterium]